MTKLVDIEGVGPVYAKKLLKAGITSTGSLLKIGATPKGRKEIAEKSGIGEHLVLEWVNRVDLYRIKGVGSEYSDLLEASGVDTVVEFSKRTPANLHKKMVEINAYEKESPQAADAQPVGGLGGTGKEVTTRRLLLT